MDRLPYHGPATLQPMPGPLYDTKLRCIAPPQSTCPVASCGRPVPSPQPPFACVQLLGAHHVCALRQGVGVGGLRSAFFFCNFLQFCDFLPFFRNVPHFSAIFPQLLPLGPPRVLVGSLCVPCAEGFGRFGHGTATFPPFSQFSAI